MQALRPVIVDLAGDVVFFGDTCLTLERDGEHYVAPGGLRARALTFEERSRVVVGALMEREPGRALLSKLRSLANLQGVTDGGLADALLLALAGGGEEAPDFAECAHAACRNGNLNWQSLRKTPAVVVDQLASATGKPKDDEWTRFIFLESNETPSSMEDSFEQMPEQEMQQGTGPATEVAAALQPSQIPAKSRDIQDNPQADHFASAEGKVTPVSSPLNSDELRGGQTLRARVTLSSRQSSKVQGEVREEVQEDLSSENETLRELSRWSEQMCTPQSAQKLDEWTRFEFHAASETSLPIEDCCRQMLERLLKRGTPQKTEQTPEIPAEPYSWQISAKLHAEQIAPQTDPLDFAGTKPSLQANLASLESEQPLRVRVTLNHTAEPLRPSSEVPGSSSSDRDGLREIFHWSEESYPVASRQVSQSEEPSSRQLRDVTPKQTTSVPEKAPITASRLRNLPAGFEQVTVPTKVQEHPSMASAAPPAPLEATRTELLPHSPQLQRDWLYEIATALADECDLRGLDA